MAGPVSSPRSGSARAVGAEGVLQVWPPVVLAPGRGHQPGVPLLCREYGAGLCVSETITARGTSTATGSPHSWPLGRCRSTGPTPWTSGRCGLVDEASTISTSTWPPCPRSPARAAGAIPVKPRLLARLVRSMGRSRDVPVTVKMRKGIHDGLLTFEEAGRAAEGEGASAVGLHARTAAELYSGEADWDAIGRLVEVLDVPVLGNGDIWESFDALRMMRATGCAGVIVGRGCLGRPCLRRAGGGLRRQGARRAPQLRPDRRDHDGPRPSAGGPVRPHGGRAPDAQVDRLAHEGLPWAGGGPRQVMRIEALEDIRDIVADLDAAEPFPETALRAMRAKGSKTQSVNPRGVPGRPHGRHAAQGAATLEEIEAWEKALNGG